MTRDKEEGGSNIAFDKIEGTLNAKFHHLFTFFSYLYSRPEVRDFQGKSTMGNTVMGIVLIFRIEKIPTIHCWLIGWSARKPEDVCEV